MRAKIVAIVKALFIVFVAGVAAELIPGHEKVEPWFEERKTMLLVVHSGAAAFGLLLLLGSVLSLLIESDARPRGGRVSGHDQFTLFELKSALSTGALFRSALWRRRLVAIVGAIFMTLGVMGVVIVLAPLPIKLLCAVALAYAVVRTVWALASVALRAGP